MNNKELILSKINELRFTNKHGDEFEQGFNNALDCISNLLNSLPAEQPSEDLDIDEELTRYFELNNLYVDSNDLQTVRHCNGSQTDKRYYFEDIARHFANWQKEQMMKSAIDGTVGEGNPGYPQWGEHLPTIAYSDVMLLPKNFKFGDKIKIIVIKEDEQ